MYTNRPFLGRKTSWQLYFEALTKFHQIQHKLFHRTSPIFWKCSHKQVWNSFPFASLEIYQQLPRCKFLYFPHHRKNPKFHHKIFYSDLSRGFFKAVHLRLRFSNFESNIWYPFLIGRNSCHQIAPVWVEFRILHFDIVRPKWFHNNQAQCNRGKLKNSDIPAL